MTDRQLSRDARTFTRGRTRGGTYAVQGMMMYIFRNEATLECMYTQVHVIEYVAALDW